MDTYSDNSEVNYENYFDNSNSEQTNTEATQSQFDPNKFVAIEQYQDLNNKFAQMQTGLKALGGEQQPQKDEIGDALRQRNFVTKDDVSSMFNEQLSIHQGDMYARQEGFQNGFQELVAQFNLQKVLNMNNPQNLAILNQLEMAWDRGNIQGAVKSFKNFLSNSNSQVPTQTQVIGHQIGNSPASKQQFAYSSRDEYQQRLMAGDPEARRLNLKAMSDKNFRPYPD